MQKEGDGAKVNFNSIKVRLKQSIVHDNNKFILEFQFHKGTIKTHQQGGRGSGRSPISIP